MKKTLLIAAAALVAATISSEAQVYSANVVGYVNTVLPGNGQYTLIANPFDDGNGNHLTNLLSASLPGGNASVRSTLFYFNGAPVNVSKLASGWSADVVLAPGTGFFVRNGAPGANAPTLTNTFVGNVVALSGTSITNQIPNGFSLQGSTLPYGGNIAINGTPNGDPNLNYGGAFYSIGAGAGISKIQYWNTATQTPVNVNKSFTTGNWTATVAVNVGQGFWLINTSPATNMVQTLP